MEVGRSIPLSQLTLLTHFMEETQCVQTHSNLLLLTSQKMSKSIKKKWSLVLAIIGKEPI